MRGQLLCCESDLNVKFTSEETSTFFYIHSVSREDFMEVSERLTHLTVEISDHAFS